MVKLNENFFKLKESYLFSTTARKIREYSALNPDKPVIRMGIGDVTVPLAKPVADAIASAGAGMATKEGFHGYGDEQGEGFLQEAIRRYYLDVAGVELKKNEIFVSDGAKSDVANFTDLFSDDNVIIIPDPVYPVYLDSNMMLGRKITLIDGNEENGFLPMPYEGLKGDIVYLCSPNNPTGAVYSREQLKKWVDFALENGMLINPYAAFFLRRPPGGQWCAGGFCSHTSSGFRR